MLYSHLKYFIDRNVQTKNTEPIIMIAANYARNPPEGLYRMQNLKS